MFWEPKLHADWGQARRPIIVKNPDLNGGKGVALYHPRRAAFNKAGNLYSRPGGSAPGVGLGPHTTTSRACGETDHPLLIAQEIVEAERINGYRPTFRVFVSLTQDGDIITPTIHEAYWKFPLAKDRKRVLNTQNVISTTQRTGQIMTDSEFDRLGELLEKHAFPAITAMARANPLDILKDMINSPDPMLNILGAYHYLEESMADASTVAKNQETMLKISQLMKRQACLRNYPFLHPQI